MRKNLNIDYLVSDLQAQIREMKEAQFFGSDSLKLREYKETFSIPSGDLDGKMFKITMSPEKPEATMPFSCDILPAYQNNQLNANASLDCSKSGNDFIFYATLQPNYSEIATSCVLKIIYCGKANFSVEEIN